MFRVSKLTDYATLLMTYLALEPSRITNARDITLHTHVKLPTVSKLLKVLAKKGLLISHRGSKGGYSLVRSPEKIRLTEIIDALEGELGLTECSHGDCNLANKCLVKHKWRTISSTIRGILEKVTLADMAHPLPQLVVKNSSPE